MPKPQAHAFGWALEELRRGYKVWRKGWPYGYYLKLLKEKDLSEFTSPVDTVDELADLFIIYRPQNLGAQAKAPNVFFFTHEDLLAKDWKCGVPGRA